MKPVGFAALFTLLALAGSVMAELPQAKLHNGYDPAQLKPYLEAHLCTVFSLDPRRRTGVLTDDPFAIPAPPPGTKVPPPPKNKPVLPPPELNFHNYEILGQVTVKVTPELQGVITALDHAGQHWEGGVSSCFSPRHGLRVVKNGVTYDLLICYECMRAELFEGGKDAGLIGMTGREAPQPDVLNALLDKARVKRMPAPH